MDRYSGTPDRDLWRAELDQPDRSQGFVSRAAYTVSGIHLDDRRRIRAAKNGQSIVKAIRLFVIFEGRA